jgi:hypothetical protein
MCTISNCHYWAHGNICKADGILVTSDAAAKSLPNTWDAPVAHQLSATPVPSATVTCCKTYAGKSACGAFDDGVRPRKP